MTIKKLFKKAIGAIVAGAMVVAMAVPAMAEGNDTEKTVWTGSVTSLSWDDGVWVKLTSTQLDHTFVAGDQIVVEYEVYDGESTDTYSQIKISDKSYGGLAFSNANEYKCIDLDRNATSVSATVTDKIAQSLNVTDEYDQRLFISGFHVKIKSVKIKFANNEASTPAETTPAETTPAETTPAETTPAETTSQTSSDGAVWSGSIEIGAKWGGKDDAIPGTALKDVKAGDKLVIAVKPTADKDVQLKVCADVKVDGGWSTIYENYDIPSGTTEVEIKIDDTVLENLKTVAGSYVAIQGKNITVTSVKVKSSTEAVTEAPTTASTEAPTTAPAESATQAASPAESATQATASNATGDSANIGLIIALAAAVAVLGVTVAVKKRATEE